MSEASTECHRSAKRAYKARCPLQQAGDKGAHLPIVHLLNRPKLALLQQAIAASFAPAA